MHRLHKSQKRRSQNRRSQKRRSQKRRSQKRRSQKRRSQNRRSQKRRSQNRKSQQKNNFLLSREVSTRKSFTEEKHFDDSKVEHLDLEDKQIIFENIILTTHEGEDISCRLFGYGFPFSLDKLKILSLHLFTMIDNDRDILYNEEFKLNEKVNEKITFSKESIDFIQKLWQILRFYMTTTIDNVLYSRIKYYLLCLFKINFENNNPHLPRPIYDFHTAILQFAEFGEGINYILPGFKEGHTSFIMNDISLDCIHIFNYFQPNLTIPEEDIRKYNYTKSIDLLNEIIKYYYTTCDINNSFFRFKLLDVDTNLLENEIFINIKLEIDKNKYIFNKIDSVSSDLILEELIAQMVPCFNLEEQKNGEYIGFCSCKKVLNTYFNCSSVMDLRHQILDRCAKSNIPLHYSMLDFANNIESLKMIRRKLLTNDFNNIEIDDIDMKILSRNNGNLVYDILKSLLKRETGNFSRTILNYVWPIEPIVTVNWKELCRNTNALNLKLISEHIDGSFINQGTDYVDLDILLQNDNTKATEPIIYKFNKKYIFPRALGIMDD